MKSKLTIILWALAAAAFFLLPALASAGDCRSVSQCGDGGGVLQISSGYAVQQQFVQPVYQQRVQFVQPAYQRQQFQQVQFVERQQVFRQRRARVVAVPQQQVIIRERVVERDRGRGNNQIGFFNFSR